MSRLRFALVVGLTAACAAPEFQQVDLAADTTLPSQQTVRFSPVPPLQTPGDNNQVCLTPAPPFAIDDSLWGIRGPNGNVAWVRGVLIRPDGERDSLDSKTIWGDSTEHLCLMLRVGQAPSRTYTAVILTSTQSVPLRRVFWLSTSK